MSPIESIDEIVHWQGIALDFEMRHFFAFLGGTLGNPTACEVSEVDVVRQLFPGIYTASLLVSGWDVERAMAVSRLTEPRWKAFSGANLADLMVAASMKASVLGHGLIGTEHLLWALLVDNHPPMLYVLRRCAASTRRTMRFTTARIVSLQYGSRNVLASVESFLTDPYYPFGPREYMAMKRDVVGSEPTWSDVKKRFFVRFLARRSEHGNKDGSPWTSNSHVRGG